MPEAPAPTEPRSIIPAAPGFEPTAGTRGAINIQGTGPAREMPLTEKQTQTPGTEGDFINRVDANRRDAAELRINLNDTEGELEDHIIDILIAKAQAVQASGESAPNDVIFGTAALRKYQERWAWRQRRNDFLKSSPKGTFTEAEPADLTKGEVAAAYYEILAEIKLQLDASGQEVVDYLRVEDDPYIRFVSGTLNYLLKRIDHSKDVYRTSGAPSHIVAYLEKTGFRNKTPKEQAAEIKRLDKYRRAMFHSITGEWEDNNAFQNLVGISNDALALGTQGENTMHLHINQSILGTRADAKKGILGGEEYRKYLGDRNWEDIPYEEKAAIWRRVAKEDQNKLVYKGIQLAVGSFCEEMGKQIQKNVGSKAIEGSQDELKEMLKRHTSSTSNKETLESQVESLKAEKAEIEATLRALTTIEDLEATRAEYQKKLGGPKAKDRSAMASAIDSLTTKIAAERDKIKDPRILAELAKSKAKKKTAIIDGLKNRLDGTGGKVAISVEIEERQLKIDQLKATTATSEGGVPRVLDTDVTGRAILKALHITSTDTFNNVMDQHFTRGLSEYTENTRNADGITTGIVNWRRAFLDQTVGHPDVPHSDLLNELMFSELDFIKSHAEAFRMTDINLNALDTAENRARIDVLNGLLIKVISGDNKPATITALNAARNAVDVAMRSDREKVFAEIARRNKWEESNVLRLAVMRIRDRVTRGNPFAQGEAVIQQPPTMRERQAKLDASKPPELPRVLAEKLLRRNRVVGAEVLMDSVRINKGAHQGEYFLIVEPHITNPGPPPVYGHAYQVYDAKGHSYGEIGADSLRSGRVTQEGAAIRQEFVTGMGMNIINHELDTNGVVAADGEREFTLGVRTFRREKETGRLYEHSGWEKTQRPLERIYLDEEVAENRYLTEQLLMLGENRLSDMRHRVIQYATHLLNAEGTVETQLNHLVWHDNINPNQEIEVDFGLGILRQDTNVTPHAVLQNAPWPIFNFTSFAEIESQLHTGLNPGVEDNFYAGMFQRFMDYNDNAKRAFITSERGFHNIGLNFYWYGDVQISAEHGNLVVKRLTDAAGRTLTGELQEHQTLQDFLNKAIISGDPGWGVMVKKMQAAVGKEYFRALYNRVSVQRRTAEEIINDIAGGVGGTVRRNF